MSQTYENNVLPPVLGQDGSLVSGIFNVNEYERLDKTSRMIPAVGFCNDRCFPGFSTTLVRNPEPFQLSS
jgi:hypothetical protein